MNHTRLIATLFAALAVTPLFAQDTDANAVIGKVERHYVRESPNFFIEKRLVRKPRNDEQWTEVRFAAPLADGRKSEIVRLPQTASVERGDLISTQIVDKRDAMPGLIPEENRMISLVAKHDTLAAIMFDLPKPSPTAVMPFVQALQVSK
jgi:hypothetical protein